MSDAGELLHIDGPIWLVAGEEKGKFPHSHSVLVWGDETVLIDTGAGPSVLRSLESTIGRSIDVVLNTHTHPDHCAGNGLFASRPLLVPEMSLESAGDLVALSERFFDAPSLRPTWRRFVRSVMEFSDRQPTGSFHAGEVLQFGRTKMTVLHTPGHTLDHCCFWFEEQGVLVSGDIDLTSFGPWYGHPESRLKEVRSSIRAMGALEPAVVLSAHRAPVRDGVAQAFERYERVLDRRSTALLEYLELERSWDEIVEAALIYRRFPMIPNLMRYWEGLMIGKHLVELIEAGEVLETGRRAYQRAR